jgi:hypothetical protein
MKSFIFSIVFLNCFILSYSQSPTNTVLSEFGLSFMPDNTFKGSSLKGWHVLGDAEWQASNGELIGKAKANSGGGWLVLDNGYQDIGFHSLFKATGNSETAVLLRMEKIADGYRGVLLSLKKGDVAPYSVALDAQGKEIKREKLRQAGGINYRIAPPPDTSRRGAGGNFGGPRNPPATLADLPVRPPNTDFRDNDWNQIETFLETNVIRSFLNDGREIGGAVDGESALSGYGPIALYVGGTGEVRFKDLSYKDISYRYTPKEQSSSRFQVQCISDFYYSWGADVADFNKDGHLDIIAGPYIHFGPDFTKHKEIYPAIAVGPSKEFTAINHQFTHDVNGDGWPDVITGWTAPAVYLNPKNESRRWETYKPIPGTQSETTLFTDIDKDGKPELVYASQGQFKYAKPEAAKTWTEYVVSERGYTLAHGIGTGDINGDGRTDLLGATGWWEQPETLSKEKTWKYHPVPFGRYKNRASNIGGAVMAVYDANGDGLNDVVSNLNVHGFGLAWFEQQRDASGNISFVRHMISDDYSQKSVGNVTFSQGHASTFADIDKDGVMDYIVGKRYFTHLDNLNDPDAYGPPVLYWYRTVRNKNAPGGAQFVPELIHNRSGAGSQIEAVDLNKDGFVDIITSTNRGTFIFWNKGRK